MTRELIITRLRRSASEYELCLRRALYTGFAAALRERVMFVRHQMKPCNIVGADDDANVNRSGGGGSVAYIAAILVLGLLRRSPSVERNHERLDQGRI
jgi:hypothetical protein